MPLKYLALGSTVLMSACATDHAIVTGIDGNSVEIQTLQFGDSSGSVKAQNEAIRVCAKRGYRKAEYVSTRADNYKFASNSRYVCTN